MYGEGKNHDQIVVGKSSVTVTVYSEKKEKKFDIFVRKLIKLIVVLVFKLNEMLLRDW